MDEESKVSDEISDDDLEIDIPDEDSTTFVSGVDGEVKSGRLGYRKVEGPRLTAPYMTKYEKTRVIGTRALQISLNAPLNCDSCGITDPVILAELELKNECLPFIIRRYLPGNYYEDWSVKELICDF